MALGVKNYMWHSCCSHSYSITIPDSQRQIQFQIVLDTIKIDGQTVLKIYQHFPLFQICLLKIIWVTFEIAQNSKQ